MLCDVKFLLHVFFCRLRTGFAGTRPLFGTQPSSKIIFLGMPFAGSKAKCWFKWNKLETDFHVWPYRKPFGSKNPCNCIPNLNTCSSLIRSTPLPLHVWNYHRLFTSQNHEHAANASKHVTTGLNGSAWRILLEGSILSWSTASYALFLEKFHSWIVVVVVAAEVSVCTHGDELTR